MDHRTQKTGSRFVSNDSDRTPPPDDSLALEALIPACPKGFMSAERLNETLRAIVSDQRSIR